MPDTRRDAIEPIPKAWPFEEAAKLARRLDASGKDTALFATGYGPSGLPHIGTFGEVARTTWVRHAFEALTGRPSRLLAFSDDMDGLRKVPDNVPNRAMLEQFLGQPLTRVPDPFGTLGPERRATYSPFLPIHPRTGRVMQVRIDVVDAAAGTVSWQDPDNGERFETSVTGGACKLQWKADWAMRWFALGVDYEMSGKDLIDSVRLSGRVCSVLGSPPPVGFTYELFLDEHAQKISKSKGNGLSVEEWLRYAPPESLAQFMYNSPGRAKRLFFDVIPRAVDEFLANAAKLPEQDMAARYANPAWHIQAGRNRGAASPVPFGMLLNLASVVNADTPDMLWGFIHRYHPGTGPDSTPFLARLVDHAVAYYRDFVRPAKRFRTATATEAAALADLADTLAALPPGSTPEAIQDEVYAVGKRHPFPALKQWFECLYQVLLGQQEGPRFGGFVALYGVAETVALIRNALVRPAQAA